MTISSPSIPRPPPLVRFPDGESNVRPPDQQDDEDEFQECPSPARLVFSPLLLVPSLPLALARAYPATITTRSGFSGTGEVEIVGVDLDDVVIVREFARVGAEAEVGCGGDGDVADVKAFCPLVDILVLQVELQVLVLKVEKTRFGRHRCTADSASLKEDEVSQALGVGR